MNIFLLQTHLFSFVSKNLLKSNLSFGVVSKKTIVIQGAITTNLL